MQNKRFVVELGTGADLHGADMTKAAVLAVVPIGEKSLEVTPGGLRAPGLEVACFGPGCSDIVMACAALTVSVDME